MDSLLCQTFSFARPAILGVLGQLGILPDAEKCANLFSNYSS